MVQNNLDSADNSPDKLARDGELYRLEGEYDLASEKFNDAIKLNPSYAWANAHLGETFRQRGSEANSPETFFTQSENFFKQATKLNSDYAWAHAHLGELYRENLKYEEAEESFKQAIMIDENYAWAYAHRGANSYDGGNLNDALNYLTKALDIIPTYAWAKLYQAIVWLRKKEFEKAVLAFLSVISLDPNVIKNPSKDIALLSIDARELKTALALFDKALNETPNDIETQYHHAVVIAKLKGLEAAKEEIQKLRQVLESSTSITLQDLSKDYILGGLAALEGNNRQAQEKLAIFDNAPKLKAKAERDLAWQPLLKQ